MWQQTRLYSTANTHMSENILRNSIKEKGSNHKMGLKRKRWEHPHREKMRGQELYSFTTCMGSCTTRCWMGEERNCCCFITTLHADIHAKTATALLISVVTTQLKTVGKTMLERQKHRIQQEKRSWLCSATAVLSFGCTARCVWSTDIQKKNLYIGS